jgi:hypothetical protein
MHQDWTGMYARGGYISGPITLHEKGSVTVIPLTRRGIAGLAEAMKRALGRGGL